MLPTAALAMAPTPHAIVIASTGGSWPGRFHREAHLHNQHGNGERHHELCDRGP